MNIIDKRASNPAAALDGTELVYVAQLGADAVTTVQDIKDFATNGVFSDATFRIQDNANATKQLAFEVSGVAAGTTRTITMPDANVDLGQTGKGSFTPKELLASSGSQNLEANYSYYLPAFYAGALNLVMPASAAIGTTFDIGSIYSNGIDGTLGANLTALNLTLPAGEFITGWGVGIPTINLLVSYVTGTGGYTTPNFTQGCTFRLTKTGATSWAIKPTFGSALPQRFIVKNEGGVGGTEVSTAVPAGTYRELTLPNADVDLGTMSSVATTDFNNLSGTRTRILGGSYNTVSGTDNVAVGCNLAVLSNTKQAAILASDSDLAALTTKGAFIQGGIGTSPRAVKVGLVLSSLTTAAGGGDGTEITSDGAAGSSTNRLFAGMPCSTGLSTASHDITVVMSGVDSSHLVAADCVLHYRLFCRNFAAGIASIQNVTLLDSFIQGSPTTASVAFSISGRNVVMIPSLSKSDIVSYTAHVFVTSHYGFTQN